jgi:hypothetical protein
MAFLQKPSRHNNGAMVAILVAVLAAVVGGSVAAKKNKKQ